MAKTKKHEDDLFPISVEEQRFCYEYAKDEDIRRACRVLKISVKDGQEFLKNKEVIAEIESIRERRKSYANPTPEKVIQALSIIGFANIGMFAQWNGSKVSIVDSDLIDPELMLALQTVTQKPVSDYEGGILGYETTVRMKDSVKALELLGKHLNMWEGDGGAKKDKTASKERLLGAIKRLGFGKSK